MTRFLGTTIHFSRGLIAAILSAVGGMVACLTLAFGFTALRWLVMGATHFDREYDLNYLREYIYAAVLECAVVCACAGWATYAPVGTYRFGRSLVLIVVTSLPLRLLLWSMQVTPVRYKSIQHPLLYPSELMLIIGPPVAAAIILTTTRIVGSSRALSTQKSLATEEQSKR